MASDIPPTLKVQSLSCERDGRALFAGLNFELAAGTALQVVGANGAGKSTLIRTLIGSASDFHGEILWGDAPYPHALPQLRQSLLYIGHNAGIRRGLTPLENLTWYGASPQAALDALAAVDLYGFEDLPCQQLSAGQNRRVALARLYLPGVPRLWILDEPLAALDVRGVANLEQRMSAHLGQGGSILLTSHQPVSLSSLRLLDLADFAAEPLGESVFEGVGV